MNDLRERVMDAIRKHVWNCPEPDAFDDHLEGVEEAADAAIRATVEALLADLDSEHGPYVMFSPTYEVEDDMIQRKTFADWLRSFLDAGRDGEATDAQ